MDDYALKQQLTGELKETLRIKQLNLELMDSLETTIIFLIQEAEKVSQTLPNLHRLQALLRRVKSCYNELYPINREFTGRTNNHRLDRTCVVVLSFFG